jgi:glycosyltransferase involved in cell wall biosynthesis
MVSHEEVPALMSACDILAAPHAAKEGFVGSPTKVFEYLAAGRAIVASRLEQMSQVLEDEKTAILTTPSDVGELTNALRRLANDSQTRASLGNSARASAVRSHTWAHRAERLVADLSSGGR